MFSFQGEKRSLKSMVARVMKREYSNMVTRVMKRLVSGNYQKGVDLQGVNKKNGPPDQHTSPF